MGLQLLVCFVHTHFGTSAFSYAKEEVFNQQMIDSKQHKTTTTTSNINECRVWNETTEKCMRCSKSN